MTASRSRAMALTVVAEPFPFKEPFTITGHTISQSNVVTVTLEQDGCIGRGEAAGVYYHANADAPSMMRQIEALRSTIEAGVDRRGVQKLLPIGGARNALDCALWDLEAKLERRPAWAAAELAEPRPLLTTFTVSAKSPADMAAGARGYATAKAIKLKLTGEPMDVERVQAVREARPDVWLGVDANQGFTRPFLENIIPVLLDARVALIEQPFPIGSESQLAGFRSPIPLAADESVQGLADLPSLVGKFNVINIKLDKCGGLTEGLAMARAALALGLDVMVGNMMGTSLAMAPSFLLGQLCQIVDLDGPVFLSADRPEAVVYDQGMISCPESLWGYPLG